MNLQEFKKIISLLQQNSKTDHGLYKLGVDLFETKECLLEAITLLFKSYYSEIGEDTISWWLYEDVDKHLYDNDDNIINDLTKVEDLWEYVENIRISSEFVEYDFAKKKKLSKKQREKMFKKLFDN